MFVDVLVELKAKNIDKTFIYSVPSNLICNISIGKRVVVPFSNQKLEGFILDIKNNFDGDFEVKDILEIVDENPVLNEELLSLGKYISKKTLCNLIHAYQTMLPTALKAHKSFNVNKKYITYITLIDKTYVPKNETQKKILELLNKGDVLKCILTKISLGSVNTLIKKNIIKELSEEVYRLNDTTIYEDKKVVLNNEQQNVVDTVKKSLNLFKPFLLYGVTGSGKTEVYMHIIDEVLKNGKQVIVLVPEISLTPQMVNLFKSRFKSNIAILHSALSDGEKYDEWRKIERKEVNIVIGARSAVFAPFTNIGLIVVDEEHSDTYKQDNNPRYSAIDIALFRAKTYNCPVIFGSATPSIESFVRAQNNIYELLELKSRVNNKLPHVEIVNMTSEIKKGNKILSSKLASLISEKILNNEQVILLLNRRGYSTTITCKCCGEVIKCPNCDIPLTYHKNGNKLNCHYCNYTTYKPKYCPNCKSEDINSLGIGTEKLEEEVNKRFTGAKVVRMDVDTTRRKGSHERIINDFKNKKYNILIGTQMIAKGLDFQDVTLVGVINGDATLNIPDFRSGERTYSLLNQVAGRAGRKEKDGVVIIQCFNTDHYSIVCAANHDYLSFYKNEMQIRKKLNYPPFYNICLIKISSIDYEILKKEADKIANYLKESTKNVIILGPSLNTIPKIYNKYYINIILKYKNLKDVYDQLMFILNKNRSKKNLVFDIDFNPRKL